MSPLSRGGEAPRHRRARFSPTVTPAFAAGSGVPSQTAPAPVALLSPRVPRADGPFSGHAAAPAEALRVLRLHFPRSPPLDLSPLLQASISAPPPGPTHPSPRSRCPHLGPQGCRVPVTKLAAGTCVPPPSLRTVSTLTGDSRPAVLARRASVGVHGHFENVQIGPRPPPGPHRQRASRVHFEKRSLRPKPGPAAREKRQPPWCLPLGPAPPGHGVLRPLYRPPTTGRNKRHGALALVSIFCKVPGGRLSAAISGQVEWPAGVARVHAVWLSRQPGRQHSPLLSAFPPRFIIKSSRTSSLGKSCWCT